MRPRERSEQSWSIFQRWKFIWVEEPARLWNRLSPVMFPEPKVRASQSATSPTKGRGWRRVLIFSNKCKKQERSSIRFFLLILKSCTFEKKSKFNITSGLCEVQFPRKFRPREDFPHMDGKSEQRWRNFQSWNWIWETEVQRGFRISPLIHPHPSPLFLFTKKNQK